MLAIFESNSWIVLADMFFGIEGYGGMLRMLIVNESIGSCGTLSFPGSPDNATKSPLAFNMTRSERPSYFSTLNITSLSGNGKYFSVVSSTLSSYAEIAGLIVIAASVSSTTAVLATVLADIRKSMTSRRSKYCPRDVYISGISTVCTFAVLASNAAKFLLSSRT